MTIEERTPYSVTTTDNAIFRINQDVTIQEKGIDIIIPEGLEVRILACKLDPRGRTPVRFLGEDIYINNEYLVYVEGEIGDQVNAEK